MSDIIFDARISLLFERRKRGQTRKEYESNKFSAQLEENGETKNTNFWKKKNINDLNIKKLWSLVVFEKKARAIQSRDKH